MKIRQWPWQQDLGGGGRRLLLGITLTMALESGILGNACAGQSFAVALPELEGPVTLAIFSKSGERVRLLYTDAAVDSIPAGLNGLIMTWDGKNDQGKDVPAGVYTARGIVHGPIAVSALPQREMSTARLATGLRTLPLVSERPVFSDAGITIRAAQDELLESRPLLTVAAALRGNDCVITAEGLPLVSIPNITTETNCPPSIVLSHGTQAGTALLRVEEPSGAAIYTIKGLDRLVPLSAGALEVQADAFHPMPSAGESAP